jgi:hypothetical protein
MKIPDILNSKIKKIRIELPHYTFSHSSSGDSPYPFIGRERIRERLKKVVEDSPNEPGVYLVAGNRGVGKTSLVSWVINASSLPAQSSFAKNLRYLFLLLFFVAGVQFFLEKNLQFVKAFWISAITSVPIFTILCFSNGYRQKFYKKNICLRILDSITSAIKELSYIINPYNQYERTQYVLKIILVVCYTQIASKIQFCDFVPFIKFRDKCQITPIQTFVFYICFILSCAFWRSVRNNLHKYYVKNKKDRLSNKSICNIENKVRILWKNWIFKYCTTLMLLFLPLAPFGLLHKSLIMIVPFVMVFIFTYAWCCKYLKKEIWFECMIQIIFSDTILTPIKNYIKNHNRLYLRINFGHKLKDEKDVLRLIARTLSTEYNKFHRLFLRILPWRVMALGFLLMFAFLFSPIVEEQEFYKSLIKGTELYQASSQVLLENHTLEDKERLSSVFSRIDIPEAVKVVIKTKDETDKILNKRIKQKFRLDVKVGKIGNFFLVLDQLVYEMTKIVKKIPQYFWTGKVDFKNEFILPLNYLFWLLFLLMYLFCKLLFHFAWIMHLFVTHRIIMKKIKKLNSDITYSTERENSIGINSERISHGMGIKTKKSRNIADAREIEKELQDILYDMQRIPVIMCRPKIVIVFDELDKVEPGDAGSEKEIPQTKASMFSIDAARDRQTEILRILSNMKYFLSTARAKFIFIAGREMYDIHLADVSERNNYIGSIFNAVIFVPSFLTDHHTGKKFIPQESSIASLPEEFVCRRLIPYDYPVESYDLKSYQTYLEKVIYKKKKKDFKDEEIQKIIAVLQQFIIYLAHVSKGAPKKMIQLFESFIEIQIENDNKNKNTLFIQRYHGSQRFLSFNYYRQYTLGIVAYLITPIFYRLAESNIKEHSDKLLVSSLRFVDFVFKFHKHSFSWKHLDMSPEMLEANRAPELKSVTVDLLNYLAQVHINRSNFSLSEYKFDDLIANEIFAMAKTDEVFSALFSFSLDETLPLKKHYQDLLERTEKEYQKEYWNGKTSVKYSDDKYVDAVSSLQGVLGDLYYYDDDLEEAETYYKNSVQALRYKNNNEITLEQLYEYVRNMLRLGIIYEKRKQYDFAYLTYGELCERIIRGRDNAMISIHAINLKKISSISYNMLFEKMTYEGLKMLYLPFIAKLQILEKSHVGGITRNHLEQLDKEFEFLTYDIDHEEAKLLEAEFYSRVADILYYKNSDLKCKKNKNRKEDKNEDKLSDNNDKENLPQNYSCTACDYYLKALSTLLDKPDLNKPGTVKELLLASTEQIKDNYNMKSCTVLARILSDWGNVFFSCDITTSKNRYKTEENKCYICDKDDYNTISKINSNVLLDNCIKYLESEKETENNGLEINKLETKKDIAFAMYTISSVVYRKASLYKRSSYQLYKMLCLFKHYKIYNNNYIKPLSERAIHYLWYANDDLNVLELNKRKKDFDKETIKENDIIPLQSLLVDSEITKIRILVKELELKSDLTPKKLKEYYGLRITSPYKINYSIVGRIYRLYLKSIVNYEAYQCLLKDLEIEGNIREKKYVLENEGYNKLKNNISKEYVKDIFGKEFDIKEILENLIAETIYCLTDIAQLTETMDETYLFPHSFTGSVHDHLSFWIRQYEEYEKYKEDTQIEKYLKQYLDEEWREQLSGYRENQRALSHYYKCLEMHKEGRAYHNMIDIMYYLRDDFNERSDHFNIAEERYFIVNGKIDKKINDIKDIYKDSKLYKVDNYFEKGKDEKE